MKLESSSWPDATKSWFWRKRREGIAGLHLGIDLDGVTYEWEKTARFLLKWYRHEDTVESEFWDHLRQQVSQESWDWLWREGVDLGLFRHGHLTQGAREAIKTLNSAGAHIHFITLRPKRVAADTHSWLGCHFHDMPYEVVFANDKANYPYDLFIDDKPKVLKGLQVAGKQGICFRRKWNRGFDGPGVGSWLELQNQLVSW